MAVITVMLNEKEKNSENNETTSIQENDSVTEANKRKKEAAEAAETLAAKRAELEEQTSRGAEHPHDDRDTSYMDEVPQKLSVAKILKYVCYGVIVFVFALIFWRIYMQNDKGFDFTADFVWTRENIEAYQNGSLTVTKLEMASFSHTLERDENNIPTETYDYSYSPFNESDETDSYRQYDGVFKTDNVMYIAETKELIFTVRVNRNAYDFVAEKYGLSDSSKPSGDAFRFAITDGTEYYTEYEYMTATRSSYYYYRIVFKEIPLELIETNERLDATAADIVEYNLLIYSKDFFNFNSPMVETDLLCNFCKLEKYNVKNALPAEASADLKKGPKYSD